jgi:2-hydroxychromene-2-carboxylate isomerase
MSLSYDLFWSFRSPYSYLLTPRLLELGRDFDVKANVRPVYPYGSKGLIRRALAGSISQPMSGTGTAKGAAVPSRADIQ